MTIQYADSGPKEIFYKFAEEIVKVSCINKVDFFGSFNSGQPLVKISESDTEGSIWVNLLEIEKILVAPQHEIEKDSSIAIKFKDNKNLLYIDSSKTKVIESVLGDFFITNNKLKKSI